MLGPMLILTLELIPIPPLELVLTLWQILTLREVSFVSWAAAFSWAFILFALFETRVFAPRLPRAAAIGCIRGVMVGTSCGIP
jgi:hypothetical protein